MKSLLGAELCSTTHTLTHHFEDDQEQKQHCAVGSSLAVFEVSGTELNGLTAEDGDGLRPRLSQLSVRAAFPLPSQLPV